MEDKPIGFVKPDSQFQVFFYEQDFYVLSNFSAFRVQIGSQDYDTAEHAYHNHKFNDCWEREGLDTDGRSKVLSISLAISNARSAHDAFKLAGAHKEHQRPDWDAVKLDVMRKILRAKVDQHEYVRRKLLDTGDRGLVEDSWRDDFWGWGPTREGQNMLGKLWMEVRAELRLKQEAA